MIHSGVFEEGIIFIIYVFLIGLAQSLMVFWMAYPYINVRKNKKRFIVKYVLVFTLHDAFWSLFGDLEGQNDYLLAMELVIFYLFLFVTLKQFCVGRVWKNLIHLLATEGFFQVFVTFLTFPIYVVICSFNMEEISKFLDTPSLFNALYIWVLYFIGGYGAKRIWDFWNRQGKKYFKVLCVLFTFIDVAGLLMAGWRILGIVFLVGLYGVISSFLNQSKNEKALREQFDYYNKLMETQKQREKEISVIRHDIANHLNVMEEMQKDEEGQKLLKKIDKKSRNFTGIPVVDCLIREKEKLCEKEGISFTKEGVTIKDTKISEYELVSLFANLLDNAIEAAKNVRVESENRTAEKETENAVENVVECIVENPREDVAEKVAKRMVKLVMTRQQGYIKIVVRNTKLSTQKPIDNNFMTTKKRKAGMGLEIIL